MTVPVDRPLLVQTMKDMAGCKYRLGRKPLLSDEPKAIKSADCSGYVRYLLNRVTHGALKLKTQGSFQQRAEIKAKGFTRCDYSDCGKLDSILRVAFIAPDGTRHGHIWLTCNGLSIECCGGRGACRRAWNTPVLLHDVAACYVLSDVLP